MKASYILISLAVLAIGAVLIGCSDDDNPTGNGIAPRQIALVWSNYGFL